MYPSSISNPNPDIANFSLSIKNIVSVCVDKNLFTILKSLLKVETLFGKG